MKKQEETKLYCDGKEFEVLLTLYIPEKKGSVEFVNKE
jgi:hypothetical protein